MERFAKRFAIGAVALLAAIFACLLWIGVRARPKHPKTAHGPDDDMLRTSEERVALPPPTVVEHSSPPPVPRTLPDGTVVDRERREAIRKQLLAAHPPEPEPTTPESAATAAPAFPDAEALEIPGRLDPQYIQDRVHEDYFPLAKGCYTDALARTPGLHGRLVMKFTIEGDEKIGGIVDNASFGDGTDIDDPEFRTCMRESLLSVAFKAPDEGGHVDVQFPIDFSDDDDEAGSGD